MQYGDWGSNSITVMTQSSILASTQRGFPLKSGEQKMSEKKKKRKEREKKAWKETTEIKKQ